MKKALFSLFLVLFQLCVTAQVGSFRDHLPYHNFKFVEVAPDYVYAASENSLMYLDKSDNSTYKWSKMDGLSECGIATIHYDRTHDMLIIAYSNANLDFIKNDKIYNVADIKNKVIVGAKTVNNICVNGHFAYISCGFGVVLVDLRTFLVKETWFTTLDGQNFQANDLTIFQNMFYLATDKGIFYTPTANPNIMNFAEWTPLSDAGDDYYNIVKPFNGKLLANKQTPGEEYEILDSLFILDGQNWRYLSEITYTDVRSLDVRQDELLLCESMKMTIYDPNFRVKFQRAEWWSQIWADGRQAKFDGATKIWVADNGNGLGAFDRTSNEYDFYRFSGTWSELAFRFGYANGVIALVQGGHERSFNAWISANFSVLKNGEWHYFLHYMDDNLKDLNLYDLVSVAINPRNSDEFYVASFGNGVIRYKFGALATQFTPENSALQHNRLLDYRTDVADLAFDKYNNLWMTNSFCTSPLVVKKSDGTWQRFTIPQLSGVDFVDRILIDSRNYKWLTAPSSNKLVVFFDNNTISNTSDDLSRSIDLNTHANVQTSLLNCVVEDLEGEIWIGTNQGIKVIYNAGNAFKSTVYAQNIVIEENGAAQNLLEFENVTSIAVDAANRKWIGTTKAGVFFISPNGDEVLAHFTEENSPLFSNKINDIAINHETGEVLFATSKGVLAYHGDATESKENYDNVKVFPNPVREDYRGGISVVGLKENSFCKIVDAAGNLLWQGYSNGGQLTWDGKDFNGKRAATGVYFIFASDKNGKKRKVAKVVFIN